MYVVSEVLWARVLATAQLPISFPHHTRLPFPHLGGKASHYITVAPPSFPVALEKAHAPNPSLHILEALHRPLESL